MCVCVCVCERVSAHTRMCFLVDIHLWFWRSNSSLCFHAFILIFYYVGDFHSSTSLFFIFHAYSLLCSLTSFMRITNSLFCSPLLLFFISFLFFLSSLLLFLIWNPIFFIIIFSSFLVRPASKTIVAIVVRCFFLFFFWKGSFWLSFFSWSFLFALLLHFIPFHCTCLCFPLLHCLH